MHINKENETNEDIRFRDFWEIEDCQVNSAFRKLWERIEPEQPLLLPKHDFNRWKTISIAASVALLIISGLYLYSLTRRQHQTVEVAYVTDKFTPISLSDGTKVWLSANSKLSCQQTFTGKTRDITLEGEAYFEVAHNNKQPFRVFAEGQTVAALGTCFNVRAYNEDSYVKIALIEGSVRVTNDKSGQAVILKPAQEASIIKNSNLITVNNADLDLLISWKSGRYVFNNIPFEEIAKTLEKGFKVTIQIKNKALKSKPYTMRFENGESLEKILDLIQINAKYSYHYHNGIIEIK